MIHAFFFTLILSKREREFLFDSRWKTGYPSTELTTKSKVANYSRTGAGNGNVDRRLYPTLFGREKWKRLAYFTVCHQLSTPIPICFLPVK